MATPAPTVDAVVAMRSENRTGLRAMAIVITVRRGSHEPTVPVRCRTRVL